MVEATSHKEDAVQACDADDTDNDFAADADIIEIFFPRQHASIAAFSDPEVTELLPTPITSCSSCDTTHMESERDVSTQYVRRHMEQTILMTEIFHMMENDADEAQLERLEILALIQAEILRITTANEAATTAHAAALLLNPNTPPLVLLPVPTEYDLFQQISMQRYADRQQLPPGMAAITRTLEATSRAAQHASRDTADALRQVVNRLPGADEAMEVTSISTISFTTLPKMNFDFVETVYPYFKEFEILMRANAVTSERTKLTHLAAMHKASESCRQLIQPFLENARTYVAARDAILLRFGPLQPVVKLLFDMHAHINEVKTTQQWTARLIQTKAMIDIALAVMNQPETPAIRIDIANCYINGFPANRRHKLAEKLRRQHADANILQILIDAAPMQWTTIQDDDNDSPLVPLAAATIYRNSDRLRSGNKFGRGGANRNRAPLSVNRSSPTMINNIKRTDKPRQEKPSACPNCGRTPACSRPQCPANGKTCTKCGKLNHFASVCRSSSALTPAN